MMAPMRLCAMIEGQEGVTWENWVALADVCERAGLEGLFRSDHYLSVVGLAGRPTLDAWTTLGALAERTERIRLGTLVSPATFRHPSVVAKSVATVDHVSGGRVELGLGAGWNEGEHAAYGFPFPALDERMTMLEEQLEIVSRLWTEERVAFEGRHYRLEDCESLPKPVQQPRPPIIVGGSAGPRSIRLGVRFADEYNTLLASVEDCRERRVRLDEACERVGRDPASLSLSLMATTVVGSDRAEVLERTRHVLAAWGRDAGDAEEVLEERSERWIAGTPSEVVERVEALREAGVERVYLQHLAHADVEMLALVGAEVLPALDA
jgi:F420-dependent oxidoreductase-like protein